MFCPNCGAKNDDAATFCRSCGAKLSEASQTASSSSGQLGQGGIKGMVMSAFREAIALVRNPVAYMNQNGSLMVPTRSLLINYVAILAGLGFIGNLIGDLIMFAHRDRYVYAVPGAILSYVLEIIGFFIIGIAIWKVGPSFGTRTTQDVSMKLAAYSYTPVFLASILYAIPDVGTIVVFLALLYGLYILYRGIPIMLGTPTDKVFMYFIVTLVVAIIISVVLSLIAGAATSAVIH